MVFNHIFPYDIDFLTLSSITLVTIIATITTLFKMSQCDKEKPIQLSNYPCSVCPNEIGDNTAIQCTHCHMTLHTTCALGTRECNNKNVTYLINRGYKCPACIIISSEEWKQKIYNNLPSATATQVRENTSLHIQRTTDILDTETTIESLNKDTNIPRDQTLHKILTSLTEWITHLDSKTGCNFKQDTNYIDLLNEWKVKEQRIDGLLSPLDNENKFSNDNTGQNVDTPTDKQDEIKNITPKSQDIHRTKQIQDINRENTNSNNNSRNSDIEPPTGNHKCSQGSQCDHPACKSWHPTNRTETICRFGQACLKNKKGECPLSHNKTKKDNICPEKSNCNHPTCKSKHPVDRKETICRFEDRCRKNKENKCPLSHPNTIMKELIKNVKKLEGLQIVENNQNSNWHQSKPFQTYPSRNTYSHNSGYWRGQYSDRYSDRYYYYY